MIDNQFETTVLWSHVDANRHVRHSAYADFCAQARISILESAGFGMEMLQAMGLGPILFREELQYLREIRPGDHVKVITYLTRLRADGSRWSFRHELYTGDGSKAAIVNVDGAWIHLQQRKLTGLPKELCRFFDGMPRSKDFEVVAPV
jgi:acyl-CoA thioester hydrolase